MGDHALYGQVPLGDVKGLPAALDGKAPVGAPAAAVAAHEAATDPHAQYLTPARGDLRYPQLSHSHGSAGSGYAVGTVPSGSTEPVITHELGTDDIGAFVLEVVDGVKTWRPVLYRPISPTQVRLIFTVAPTAGQYRYLLLAGGPVSAHTVPVPPVELADAPTLLTDAAAGVHFILAAMPGDRVLAAPTGLTPGQRILWEITATGAPRSLTLAAAGSRSFVPSGAAPDLTIAIPAGQTAIVGAMYSAARDRMLLLLTDVTRAV